MKKQYEYRGYSIVQAASEWQVYKAGQFIGKRDTDAEAEKMIDEKETPD